MAVKKIVKRVVNRVAKAVAKAMVGNDDSFLGYTKEQIKRR